MNLFEYAKVSQGRGGPAALERQVRLRAATGVEAMIALLDVANVDREEARAAVLDVADALLDRFGVLEGKAWMALLVQAHVRSLVQGRDKP